MLIFAGCQSKRARILKETTWYAGSIEWCQANEPKGLKINVPSIWMGKVARVEKDSSKNTISDIYLEEAERLMPYSMFSKDLRLWCSSKNFNAKYPKVGEFWAFRVNRSLKGQMVAKQAVKLIYNLDAEGLRIVDPLAPKPNFHLFISNKDIPTSSITLKVSINGELIVNQKIGEDVVWWSHSYYHFPLHLTARENVIEILSSYAKLKKKFIFDANNSIGIILYDSKPWYKFENDSINFSTTHPIKYKP